ncbi:hypothetical protein ACHABQ_11185 [Nesterenkonia aurantiaca]|uniref:hypothetical protein n=1 Tax=Nesterenkonia aurantiaca TaxID=1436010 RepID=UPI003EE6CDBA
MATTETSKLRTLAGVVGIGSLALFGATACDDGGTETEDPAVEDPATEEEPMEEETMEEEPMEEEPTEDDEDM